MFLKLQADSGADAARVAASEQQQLEETVAAEREAAELEAAEAEADAAAAAQRTQDLSDDRERADRAETVAALEGSILEDAQTRVDEGSLDGPILITSCTPVGGGSADDLTAITGNFECLAVNEELANGTSSGYRFTATIEWDAGSYQWRLGG